MSCDPDMEVTTSHTQLFTFPHCTAHLRYKALQMSCEPDMEVTTSHT